MTSGFWRNYILPYPGQPEPQPPLHYKERIDFLSSLNIPNFNHLIVGNIFNSNAIPLGHNIHLALVAGLPLGGQGKSAQLEALGKILIEAAYELTLIDAILHDKTKVVLTLIGAGVFAGAYGNEVADWIIDILKKDSLIDLISTWGLQVFMVNYLDLRPHRLRDQQSIDAFAQRVRELSQKVEERNKHVAQQTMIRDLMTLTVELETMRHQLNT